MYRLSTVYQPYIYRVCTVVDSVMSAWGHCCGTTGEVAEAEEGGTEGGGQFEQGEAGQQPNHADCGTQQEDSAGEAYHQLLQGQAAGGATI